MPNTLPKKHKKTWLPKSIYLVRYKIADLFTRSDILYPNQSRRRALHQGRRISLIVLLNELVSISCLALNGACCSMKGHQARPITVPELASRTGIKQRTLERCLYQLREMGLLESEVQTKRIDKFGNLFFTSIVRRLTDKFWDITGLKEQFMNDCAYCKKHQNITLGYKTYSFSLTYKGKNRRIYHTQPQDILADQRQRILDLFSSGTQPTELESRRIPISPNLLRA